MKKLPRPRFVKRRLFKRKSERKLSARDLAVLDFLWTWKVASTQMLKEVAFGDKSQWWAYKALRQLKLERYIQALPRGKYIDLELWALTEVGFEIVLMDRDDLSQYRFKPHAPAHDYLASCLQIGNQGFHQNQERQFYTEQMLSSLTSSNFPRAFRKVETHIPDGLTVYRNGVREAVVGYEVDLNLKEAERYQHTLDYYTLGAKAHLVVWLVKNAWVAEKIVSAINSSERSREVEPFLLRVAFIALDDFKNLVWDAESILGKFKGHSIRKLHSNLLQSIGKSAPKAQLTNPKNIFFEKYKSPQKLILYPQIPGSGNFKHPSGPGEKLNSILKIKTDPGGQIV